MARTNIVYIDAVNLTVASWGTGLATTQIGASAIVDNQATDILFVDVAVGGLLEVGTTTPAAGDTMDVYAYGRYDQATASAIGGGIDALLDGTDEEEADDTDLYLAHLPLLVSLQAETSEGIHFGPRGIAGLFGMLAPPESWGLILHNNGSATMAAGSLAEYMGIEPDSV